MSVLHQQRIRITFHPSEPFGLTQPWEFFCPCCDWRHPLPTWHDAMRWAQNHLALHHCLFCIEEQMPAGCDDLLGELFERCPFCAEPCPTCDGIAVYPANYNTPTELIQDLASVRLTPVFCDACTGVVALAPLNTYPEV